MGNFFEFLIMDVLCCHYDFLMFRIFISLGFVKKMQPIFTFLTERNQEK